MPKYSFIVPVYNSGPYLEPCVSSLLAQTCQDFEILLIDDGSTDGSGAVCDRLGETHPQIRVFHKENGGAASARNYGIDRAEGEFLLFIDGDDTVEPETLEKIDRAGNCDLVIFGMAFDYYEGGSLPVRTEFLSTAYPGIHDRAWFLGNFRTLFEDNALSSACNKVFPAVKLQDSGLRFREDMTLYEDLEFVLRYLEHTECVVCLDAALYHYRIEAAKFGHKRVHELTALGKNLHNLFATLLAMEPLPEGAADLAASLHMQLLVRHLLVTRYPRSGLEPVRDYCREPEFRRALELGGTLKGQDAQLLAMLDNREDRKLLAWIRKKKTIILLRKTAKRVLKAMGLRR